MNVDLAGQIIGAVDRYWAEEVQILGIWEDAPASACLVYRRTVDPMKTLGSRFEFGANSADGTIEGFARDIAINLAEPIGRAAGRRDQHGIFWAGIPADRPIPGLPGEVVQKLGNR